MTGNPDGRIVPANDATGHALSIRDPKLTDHRLTPGQERKRQRKVGAAELEIWQQRLDAWVHQESARAQAAGDLAVKRIEGERMYQEAKLREGFIEQMSSLGIAVDASQLRVMRKFGEELKRFRDDLANADIDPEEREIILATSREMFVRMKRFFERLTADLKDSVEEQSR